MNGYGLHGKEGSRNGIVLNEVKITGNVCGEYAEFSIHQSYSNDGEDNINGFFAFPVPEDSVLSGIEIDLGGRHIVGKVEDKAEALKLCEHGEKNNEEVFVIEDILNKGYRIGLGEILPGENLSISVSYIEELAYSKGNLRLVVPALTKIEQEELCDASMNILIETLNYSDFISKTHKINIEREDNLAKITLSEDKININDEFVLNIIEEEDSEISGVIFENSKDDTSLIYLRLIPETEVPKALIEDLNIDWGKMQLEKTYPRTIEYMYGNEPFTVFAKIKGEVEPTIRVSGLIEDKRFQRMVTLGNFSLAENELLLQKVWYKKRIDSLEKRFMNQEESIRESMRKKIKSISKETGILSTETSLVLYEEFEEPVLGGVIKRILPIKYINKA